MHDPREFAHRLLSAKGAFYCGGQSRGCRRAQARWSRSQKGKGLPMGKCASVWPQDEGGRVQNCGEVPELPGGRVQGATLLQAQRTAGRPCVAELGSEAGSTPGEERPFTALGARPSSSWNQGASSLLLRVFGLCPEVTWSMGSGTWWKFLVCVHRGGSEVPGKLRPMSSHHVLWPQTWGSLGQPGLPFSEHPQFGLALTPSTWNSVSLVSHTSVGLGYKLGVPMSPSQVG